MENIKVSELRIGNHVLFIQSKNDFDTITSISTQDVKDGIYESVHLNYESSSKLIQHLQPIPLSEDWLIKFGFEKDDNGVEMHDQDYCQWYQKEFPIIGVLCQSSNNEYLFDENTDTLRIKYVHQLQNLVYGITQKEVILS